MIFPKKREVLEAEIKELQQEVAYLEEALRSERITSARLSVLNSIRASLLSQVEDSVRRLKDVSLHQLIPVINGILSHYRFFQPIPERDVAKGILRAGLQVDEEHEACLEDTVRYSITEAIADVISGRSKEAP